MIELKTRSHARALLHDITCDPAFGFAICTIIYASKATALAQACAFACTLLIITLRVVRRIDGISPRFHDDGLTLRVLGTLGLASSIYTLGTIGFGHFDGSSLSMAVMQGSSGILFAIANFMLAASMSGARALRHPLAKLLLRAETWLLGGMLCLGLMTGVTALIMLPFLMTGYALALHNIRHRRPEHHNHPKLWYAAATIGFATISPDGWLVFANLLNALCLINLEHRLTPGGLSLGRLRLAWVRA